MEFLNSGTKRAKTIDMLERNGYLIQFYVTSNVEPPVYHYVISRKDDSNILAWGQESSRSAAEEQAISTLNYFPSIKEQAG